MTTTVSKSLSLLTTRLTQLSLKKTKTNITNNVKNNTVFKSNLSSLALTKQNNYASGVSSLPPTSKFSLRHFSSDEDPDAAWKSFQKTMAYDPSTSSDMNELSKKSKRRGGKMLRKKKEKQEAMMKRQQDRMFDVGTGQFPPLRYSDDETERLLKEAYASLPEKGISKKTRQKKRQNNRFKLIRRAKRIKKLEKIATHYKRMEGRSQRVKAVKAVIEGADEVRMKDKEYQMDVFRQWALMHGLLGGQEDDVGGKKKSDNIAQS